MMIYDALVGLYIINNIGQSMSMRNKLRDVRMTKNDYMVSYFMRISQLRDQLQAIDENISDKELVSTKLNGLSNSWDSFSYSICGRKETPSFEELWISCTQEESRLISKGSVTHHFVGNIPRRNFSPRWSSDGSQQPL